MRATILIAALLAACTPQAEQAEAPAPPDASGASADVQTGASPARPATSRDNPQASADPGRTPATLAGEWRVAGIDGGQFDEPYGIALSADEEEIWWSPRCAGQSVRYRIEAARFVVVETPTPTEVCEIGLPARLPEVIDAIRASERIERTPANGIELSGNGRSLTLFGQ